MSTPIWTMDSKYFQWNFRWYFMEIDKTILKFVWKWKRSEIVKKKKKKNNFKKTKVFRVPDIETYYKTISSKRVWCWEMNEKWISRIIYRLYKQNAYRLTWFASMVPLQCNRERKALHNKWYKVSWVFIW